MSVAGGDYLSYVPSEPTDIQGVSTLYFMVPEAGAYSLSIILVDPVVPFTPLIAFMDVLQSPTDLDAIQVKGLRWSIIGTPIFSDILTGYVDQPMSFAVILFDVNGYQHLPKDQQLFVYWDDGDLKYTDVVLRVCPLQS
eukprot:TRINITY_DN14660_c0_g2_i1.p1 TRINITY_DN14660_c0_g2~~TRINITY_DN14660_c0_g2_i1.p1  ORF type:complete len:139 (-),score=24.23 TRINITY_DN14660_c0_g2_i1:112-528(-)